MIDVLLTDMNLGMAKKLGYWAGAGLQTICWAKARFKKIGHRVHVNPRAMHLDDKIQYMFQI